MHTRDTAAGTESVARLWDGNAEVWARLVRLGFDVYRDHVSLPAFVEMMPPLAGLRGLDVGCGEGYTTLAPDERMGRSTRNEKCEDGAQS